MKAHYKDYDAKEAPAILMPTENHIATFGVYQQWRAEMDRKMNGFDWSKVSEREARAVAERMMNAAKVPQAAREEYWRLFDKYKEKLNEK